MLARCAIKADGSNEEAWTSTGGAITTARNAAGDFWIEVAGETLLYDTHGLVVNGVNIGAAYTTTIGSASTIGHAGGLRIRTWNAAGAATDIPAGIVVAIFND